jgi:hypothetical protein
VKIMKKNVKTVKEVKEERINSARTSGPAAIISFKTFIGFTVFIAFMVCFWDTTTAGVSQRFYPDDPLWTDNDRVVDASKVQPLEDSNGFDFVNQTVVKPGERRDVRAMNVNTVDEVPDSSWFTNRIGRRDLSLDEIVRGPDRVATISLDGWYVSGGKATGVQPGFRMRNPAEKNAKGEDQTYQIEFDPPSNPEMATGAEMIGTAFYYAFGYHTVEVYVAELDPAKIVIAKEARIQDPLIGERRTMTRRDVDNVLRRGARLPNGKYRVLASRFAEGRPAGNFRYYGTRPDDPNDIIPHEHRRELRAARVFGAWLNHDDSRGVNSLDFLTRDADREYVKHYMFDFGSIMGSGTMFAQRHRAGNEYIFEPKPGWLTLASLGLYLRPWLHIKYPRVPPAVGRFEGDYFDPLTWKPEYPNPAFDNMRPDDAFWAARIVSRFDDKAIRAIVDKARYSDPRSTEYLTETLIKRRNKVLTAWLAVCNPLVDFTLDDRGALTFRNAAVLAGVATDASSYRIAWSRFDNVSGSATPIGDAMTSTAARAQAPSAIAGAAAPEFLQVDISAIHPQFKSWETPVVVHFRRAGAAWQLVGVTRQ